jgi:sterol desaturase/sphingolipid hydroxylase (fatty acid hydroxylase superfamily)
VVLSESEVQIARGVAPFLALVVGVVLERTVPHAKLRPAWRTNLGLWLVGALLMAAVCGACGWTIAAWAQTSSVGVLNALHAPFGVGIAATIVGLDLLSYLWHRANHELSFLWRFHRVHHADPDYHVSTALRFHPGELLLALPVRLGAIVLLGAPPEAVVAFEAIFGIANVLEHGNFDLPRRLEQALETVLVTPALHRRHHSTERIERDSNYGTILCLWDRVARTLRPSTSAAQFATGLPGWAGPGARSLGEMLLLPARSGRSRT